MEQIYGWLLRAQQKAIFWECNSFYLVNVLIIRILRFGGIAIAINGLILMVYGCFNKSEMNEGGSSGSKDSIRTPI